MGFRFRKTKSLLGGLVKVTVSPSGPSVSVGGKGVRVSHSRRGTTLTLSLLGTGLSYVKTVKNRRR